MPEGWTDTLPLYLHRGDGAVRIGFLPATKAENPFEFALPIKPEKLSLNYNEDILADIKQ